MKATPTPSFTPVRARTLQRCGSTHCPPGQCDGGKKKAPALQRYAAGPAGPAAAPPIVGEVLRVSGRPLDPATRAYMEPRFGHDFGRVRVHSDAKAAESARAVNALAYTVGRDVVFGAGQYAPTTSAGRRLVAHELTHVVQQRGVGAGLARQPRAVGPASDAHERAANRHAEQIVSATYTSNASLHVAAPLQPSVAIAHGPSVWVQRQEDATLPPPSETFWETWGSQFEQLRRLFLEQRYGCYCGSGRACDEVIDDIDSCCKDHDDAYDDVHVSSDSADSAESADSTTVDMWSIEGFKRTMAADAVLVGCTLKTFFDSNFYGPTAGLFRRGVALVFGGRAVIAAWLITHGF